MPNTVQVVFEIDKDEKGRTTLKQIDQGVDKIGQTAKQSGSGLESFLGFFKGAIIVEFFKQGANAAFEFGKSAVAAFNDAKGAALGLESVAKFKGLDPQSVLESVRGLNLVKSGLVSIGEASTAVKNLLQSGFSLEQSIDIVKRFGDTAAFGRQQSLGFGQAIVTATEGVRNQNSILSDNAGVTKNLSVILRERGFELQDLSDKVKGAAAREALYQGLLVETQAQVGDAAKLTKTFSGEQALLEAQQQKLLVTLGELITKNPELNEGLQSIGKTLEFITLQLKDSDSQLSKFVSRAVSDFGSLLDIVSKLARGLGAIATVLNIVPGISDALNPGKNLFNPTKQEQEDRAATKKPFD